MTKDKLTEILVAVGKIEEHLKGINGAIQDSKQFQQVTYPERTNSLVKKVDDIKTASQRNTILIGVGIAMLNLAVLVIIKYIF